MTTLDIIKEAVLGVINSLKLTEIREFVYINNRFVCKTDKKLDFSVNSAFIVLPDPIFLPHIHAEGSIKKYEYEEGATYTFLRDSGGQRFYFLYKKRGG